MLKFGTLNFLDFINAGYSLLDNLRSIKWLFQQIIELKNNMNKLKGRVVDLNNLEATSMENSIVCVVMDIVGFYRMEANAIEFNNKVNYKHNSLKSNAN